MFSYYWQCPVCGASYAYAERPRHEAVCKPAPEPAPEDLEPGPETEDSRVYHWRVQRFTDAGCTEAEAHLLASSEADVYALARLVGQGCPVTTAALILL